MTDVPESPKEFFTEYLPERFEAFKKDLAGKSSAGSMVFRVTEGGGEWSLRLKDGDLQVEDGMADDVIIQVTVPKEDFESVVVRGVRAQQEQDIGLENQVVAFRALSIDEERAGMVRNVEGTVTFNITDGDTKRRIIITPGKGEPQMESPDCTLECQISDFLEMQTGKVLPAQLAMSGKIRIVGNAQIPMSLNAVFS